MLKSLAPLITFLFVALQCGAQTPIANRVKAVVRRLPAHAEVVAKYTDVSRHCLYYTNQNRLFRYDVRNNSREEVTFTTRSYATILATWLSSNGTGFFVAVDRKGMVPLYLDNGQELWFYDSHTRKSKLIGEGYSIIRTRDKITIRRASRCLNPSASRERQQWMIRDHHYDNNGTPLGKSDEYRMK